MKNKKILCCCVGLAIGLSACTDSWNDHFVEDKSLEGSLWEAIQENSELSNFASVVKAAGYDTRLNGSQMFTVFAPTNAHFSAAESEELIHRYQTEKKAGLRGTDNQVIRQFLQNHIALYNHSVSGLNDTHITLMNGKYEVLTNTKFGESTLVDRNGYYENGVLYVIDRPEPYFANVYESLAKDGEADSLYQFLSSYNVYEFDADESVPGEIVDGKTVYLDSVLHLTNSMLREYGAINREDSNYLVLVPTNKVWKNLYEKYITYFNYNDLTAKRESMVQTLTHRAIADGTIFNLNAQKSMRDSVLSTTYQTLYHNVNDYSNPRYYLYREPYEPGGAFDGGKEVVCSNGILMKQDRWNIGMRETFLQQIKVEAEKISNVDTIIQAREPLSIRSVSQTNPFYGKISENNFVEAQPLTTASSTSVRYLIPDQLSNVGYDIYTVFVPAIAYNENASADDRLPCRVRFTITYQEQDGTVTSASLRNPEDNAVNFVTQPDVVDTLLVASNFSFPTCALNLAEPQVTLRAASNVTSSMSSKYTRTLRIDCLILRPHEEE